MNAAYIKYASLLSEKEKVQLDTLLHGYAKWPLELEEMWHLMDAVWDDLGCDNKCLDDDKIRKYYMHPVWLLNGLFAESHLISMEHRQSISDWIAEHEIKSMLDYGGGFCTLSRLVAAKNPDIVIDIFEPFPTSISKTILAQLPQINFVDHLTKEYDCVVALDVLEHVSDPLKILSNMIQATSVWGTLLIGNCFQPVIKCHLPRTFHLHQSFQKIVSKMNLNFQGRVSGCHAEIYQKHSEASYNWLLIRTLEKISRLKYKITQITNS